MSDVKKDEIRPLSVREMACLTAGVPASGNPQVDAIINQGLRYKTAADILAHLMGIPPRAFENEAKRAEKAIEAADALINAFRKG